MSTFQIPGLLASSLSGGHRSVTGSAPGDRSGPSEAVFARVSLARALFLSLWLVRDSFHNCNLPAAELTQCGEPLRESSVPIWSMEKGLTETGDVIRVSFGDDLR